jgi:hypothetical protein
MMSWLVPKAGAYGVKDGIANRSLSFFPLLASQHRKSNVKDVLRSLSSLTIKLA